MFEKKEQKISQDKSLPNKIFAETFSTIFSQEHSDQKT